MAEQNVSDRAAAVFARVKRRAGLEAPDAADDDGRVGIVRGALRAFADGKMDDYLDALHENVSWEAPTGGCFPGAGEFQGRDEVKRRFIEPVGRSYTSFGFVPDSFLDADEESTVLAVGRFVGEGVEGSAVDVPAVQLWEFKGNSVARICIFADSHPFPKLVSEQKAAEQEQSDERSSEDDERSDEDGGGEGPKSEDGTSRERADGGEGPKSQEGGDATSGGGAHGGDEGPTSEEGGDATSGGGAHGGDEGPTSEEGGDATSGGGAHGGDEGPTSEEGGDATSQEGAAKES